MATNKAISKSISSSVSSWLPKLAGLRNLLEQERSVFAAAPILLIQSQPTVLTTTSTAATTAKHKQSSTTSSSKKESSLKVSNACRHVQFLLSQQMGLRTVTVEHPVSYAYPTSTDVDRAMDLLQRVGAETVVGVGSRSAMDLAKAVMIQSSSPSSSTETSSPATTRRRGTDDLRRNLILVPATYGGVLAAAASTHSLLLDTKEEALTVYPPYPHELSQDNGGGGGGGGVRVTTTSVALEETMLDDSRRTHALLASIAIALPVVMSGRSGVGGGGGKVKGDPKSALEVIQNAVACLHVIHHNESSSDDTRDHDHDSMEQQHDLCLRTVAQAGTLLSYGLHSHDRSIPLALAACLIPKHFSEHNQVTFMASLLPAMLDMYCDDSTNISTNSPSDLLVLDPEWIQQIRQHCQHPTSPRIVTTEPMETLLASIRENQALWNCLDASDAVLVRALEQHCLLRA
jgi:hypothetical protein